MTKLPPMLLEWSGTAYDNTDDRRIVKWCAFADSEQEAIAKVRKIIDRENIRAEFFRQVINHYGLTKKITDKLDEGDEWKDNENL